MLTFWKNVGILAFAEFFLKIKALVMMPFITKYLGTINYGVWSQIMIIVSVLSPLVFLGTDVALAKFLPGQPLEQQRREFTAWFLFGFINSILIFIFLCLYSNQLSHLFFGSQSHYAQFVVLSGLNVVVTSLLSGIRNWFRIQNNAKALVWLTISQNISQMFILIWILVMKQGIYDLVLISVIFDFIFIFFYIIYFYFIRVFAFPSIICLKNYLKFGIVLLPGAYAIWATNSLDRVFMANYNSLSEIGIYSIAFTFGYTLIQVVVNPIWSLFFTKASELYNHSRIYELNSLLNQSLKLICWIIFPSIFGLILVGDNLLRLMTTEEFSKGYVVIPLILTGYLFLMISAYFETILSLRHKPYLTTFFLIVSFFINLILNFILIPRYSYIGAAFATMAAFLGQNMMSYFYFKKEKLLTLDARNIFIIFLASFIMFVILLPFKMYFHKLSDLSIIMLISSFGFFIYIFITITCKIYILSNLQIFFKKDLEYE